jgi:hypothetical protein
MKNYHLIITTFTPSPSGRGLGRGDQINQLADPLSLALLWERGFSYLFVD